MLEFEAVRLLVSRDEAERVARFWSGDHDRWVYRTFLADRDRIAAVVVRHGLQFPASALAG